jgi:hypothetical protein
VKMIDRHGKQMIRDCEAFKREASIVDISNVGKWFYEDDDREHWDLDDFPSMLSPWPVSWFEYRVPQTSNSDGVLVPLATQLSARGRAAYGTLCLTGKLDDPDEAMESDPLLSLLAEASGVDEGGLPRIDHWPSRPAFMSVFRQFLEVDEELLPLILTVAHYLDEAGRAIPECSRINAAPEQFAPHANSMNGGLLPVYYAISLLHCKNVGIATTAVPEKVRQKRLKAGREPGVSFKTLVIEPLRAQARREASGGEASSKRAMHIARGSFATYTEEKPLFGRVTGTFWRPAHVRGGRRDARTEKEYEIRAPAPRATDD